jgi:hypothetical protein
MTNISDEELARSEAPPTKLRESRRATRIKNLLAFTPTSRRPPHSVQCYQLNGAQMLPPLAPRRRDRQDALLDEALKGTFPASDPVSVAFIR